MGFYTDRVLPHLMHRAMAWEGLDPLRRRLCAGLAGGVVELGFGSGANVPFYPAAVGGVWAVEPSDTAWRLAAPAVEASPVRVVRGDLDGQRLHAADGVFDHALVSWTLCTIPDASVALSELRRVLRPGGSVHFLEHGLAPAPAVRRWQHRLEPVQRTVAGGCHLTRSPADLLRGAGFTVHECEAFYHPGIPRVAGYFTLGVAVS